MSEEKTQTALIEDLKRLVKELEDKQQAAKPEPVPNLLAPYWPPYYPWHQPHSWGYCPYCGRGSTYRPYWSISSSATGATNE